jgi:hypothetical protein
MKTLVFFLIASNAFAGGMGDRTRMRLGSRNSSMGQSAVAAYVPLFAFGTAAGTGMGAVCACTTPTGTKGETLTFARASSAVCTKGSLTSGIADGDLVTCTSNQPRVMPGGDGTGGLGLNIWSSRTNRILRSQELDNVIWIYAGTGVAAPTLTANYAAAPDGTLTAERLQIAATGTNQESIVYQAVSSGAVAVVTSFYVKGVSGSGTTDLCGYGAAYTCVPCSFVSTSWTRCEVSYTSTGLDFLFIGNDTKFNGGTSRSAVDVLIWGGQSETGVGISSYIATVGSSVARAAETAVFDVTTGGAQAISMSLSSTTTTAGSLGVYWAIGTSADNEYRSLILGATNKAQCDPRFATVSATVSSTGNASLVASNSYGCSYDGVNQAVCLAGVCENTADARTVPTFTKLYIGATEGGSGQANTVIKNVCADTTSTGCNR